MPVAVGPGVADVSRPADGLRDVPGLAAAGSTSGPPLGDDGESFPNGDPLPS